MKVSTEIDNNFGYEKITQLVDNIPLSNDHWLRSSYISNRHQKHKPGDELSNNLSTADWAHIFQWFLVRKSTIILGMKKLRSW